MQLKRVTMLMLRCLLLYETRWLTRKNMEMIFNNQNKNDVREELLALFIDKQSQLIQVQEDHTKS